MSAESMVIRCEDVGEVSNTDSRLFRELGQWLSPPPIWSLREPDYESLSDEELEELFGELLDFKRCLEGEGSEVAKTPFVDSLVAEYYSGDVWQAYDSVLTLKHPQWIALNETCPQPWNGYARKERRPR